MFAVVHELRGVEALVKSLRAMLAAANAEEAEEAERQQRKMSTARATTVGFTLQLLQRRLDGGGSGSILRLPDHCGGSVLRRALSSFWKMNMLRPTHISQTR